MTGPPVLEKQEPKAEGADGGKIAEVTDAQALAALVRWANGRSMELLGTLLGTDAAVAAGLVASRGLVFAEAMVFIVLLALGLVYCWSKGVLRWR